MMIVFGNSLAMALRCSSFVLFYVGFFL